MNMRLVAVAMGAAALFSSPAFAGDFNYENFSDVSGLSFNADARARASGGRDVARLTPAQQFYHGSVFAQDRISLTSSFSTSFTFNINASANNSFGGGDGLAFVIQNRGSNFVQPGGLGYLDADKLFAVEFDTYNNGSLDGHSDNHAAIHTGSRSPAVIDTSLGFDLKSGQDVTAWLDYDVETGKFEVRYAANGVRPDQADMAFDVDLASLIGSAEAFIGFTSSTGGGYSNHDIARWSFQQSAVPEPASWAMMIGGFGLVGGALRRRQLRPQLLRV